MTATACTDVPLPRSGVARLHPITTTPSSAPVVPLAQPQGVLDLGLAQEPPARPGLRIVTGVERELDGFCARFAQAVVEVIGGDRGVHQLMRWTTESVYTDLMRRSHALHRATPGDQRLRRIRATVRSVHLFRPHEDAAELSIHVRHGQRSRHRRTHRAHRGQVALQRPRLRVIKDASAALIDGG